MIIAQRSSVTGGYEQIPAIAPPTHALCVAGRIRRLAV